MSRRTAAPRRRRPGSPSGPPPGPRDRVAGADDPGGAEVHGDGIEGGLRAAQHHGGHPADVAVRAVGGDEVRAHRPRPRCRTRAAPASAAWSPAGIPIASSTGAHRPVSHSRAPEARNMDTAVSSPTRAGRTFSSTVRPSSAPWVRATVHIHPTPHTADGHPRQQRRDHQRAEIHRRHLPRAARHFAVRMPTLTDRAEASHTAGRMSKGLSAPLAPRTEAMVAGSSWMEAVFSTTAGTARRWRCRRSPGPSPGRLDAQGRGGVAQPQQVGDTLADRAARVFSSRLASGISRRSTGRNSRAQSGGQAADVHDLHDAAPQATAPPPWRR